MLGVNVFLKIIDKEIKAEIVHEDSQCLAFKDINPQAPVHILIIPKKVIRTHADISPADRDLLGHLHIVAAEVAHQEGLIDGYRLVINCRKVPARLCRTCICTYWAAGTLFGRRVEQRFQPCQFVIHIAGNIVDVPTVGWLFVDSR